MIGMIAICSLTAMLNTEPDWAYSSIFAAGSGVAYVEAFEQDKSVLYSINKSGEISTNPVYGRGLERCVGTCEEGTPVMYEKPLWYMDADGFRPKDDRHYLGQFLSELGVLFHLRPYGESGYFFNSYYRPHKFIGPLSAVSVSPDRELFAEWSDIGADSHSKLRVINLKSGKVIREHKLPRAFARHYTSMTFADRGRLAYLGSIEAFNGKDIAKLPRFGNAGDPDMEPSVLVLASWQKPKPVPLAVVYCSRSYETGGVVVGQRLLARLSNGSLAVLTGKTVSIIPYQ